MLWGSGLWSKNDIQGKKEKVTGLPKMKEKYKKGQTKSYGAKIKKNEKWSGENVLGLWRKNEIQWKRKFNGLEERKMK